MPSRATLTNVLASGRDPKDLLDELGYPLTSIELAWRLNALGDDGLAFDIWLNRQGLYSHIEVIEREVARLYQTSASELSLNEWTRTTQVELEESLDEAAADPDIANLLGTRDEAEDEVPTALYEHFIDPAYARLASLMLQFRQDVQTSLERTAAKARPQLSRLDEPRPIAVSPGAGLEL